MEICLRIGWSIMLKEVIKRRHKTKDKLLTPLLLEYMSHADLFRFDDKSIQLARWIMEQENTPRNESVLHPSSSASCMRMQVLGYLGYPGKREYDLTQELVFDDGKWRHLRWHLLLYRLGVTHRVEKWVSGRLERTGGTPDQTLNLSKHYPWLAGKRVGFEMKGSNSGKYNSLVRRGFPDFGHLFQVITYMILAKLDLYIIMYENKDNQSFNEFDISFNKEYREHIEDLNVLHPLWKKYMIARYYYMNRAIDKGHIPATECGMDRDDPMFRRCPQAKNCVKLQKEKHTTLASFPDQKEIEDKLLFSLRVKEEGRWWNGT